MHLKELFLSFQAPSRRHAVTLRTGARLSTNRLNVRQEYWHDTSSNKCKTIFMCIVELHFNFSIPNHDLHVDEIPLMTMYRFVFHKK